MVARSAVGVDLAGSPLVDAWPHEGIRALELWDVVVDGRSLFARRSDATFFESLASAALALRRGEALREGGGTLPACAWQSVTIVGGGVDEPRARAAFAGVGAHIEVVSRDPFFTVTAARAALAARSSVAPSVVVDVGQTAIKALGPAGRFHRPRASEPGERGRFIAEIAAAITAACGVHRVSQVVLALPCEVDAHVGLGPSTYPTAGDGIALVHAVLAARARSRIDPCPPHVAVVNDAVLAAWASVRGEASRHLVLTVGLGVGAAFVEG